MLSARGEKNICYACDKRSDDKPHLYKYLYCCFCCPVLCPASFMLSNQQKKKKKICSGLVYICSQKYSSLCVFCLLERVPIIEGSSKRSLADRSSSFCCCSARGSGPRNNTSTLAGTSGQKLEVKLFFSYSVEKRKRESIEAAKFYSE